MPATRPPEFRRRALDLVAQVNPVGQVARDLGISESCLRCWMSIDDVERWPQRGVFRVLEVAPSTYYEVTKRQPPGKVTVWLQPQITRVTNQPGQNS